MMPVVSYIEAVNMALEEEMKQDPKVFILGEDVGVKGAFLKQPRTVRKFGKTGHRYPAHRIGDCRCSHRCSHVRFASGE